MEHEKGPCDDIAEQTKGAYGMSLSPASYTGQFADTQEFISEGKKQFQ
jgi:hypothetical protein